MPSDRFVFITHVDDVFELKLDKGHYVSGQGPDAVFDTASRGWFVRLGHGENSIALRLGDEQPKIVRGQKVRMIIEIE